MSDFDRTRTVKTRKSHTCEGCYETISVGALARHSVGRYDGEFYSYYLCPACADYLDRHAAEFEPDDFWSPGQIGELRKEEVMEAAG